MDCQASSGRYRTSPAFKASGWGARSRSGAMVEERKGWTERFSRIEAIGDVDLDASLIGRFDWAAFNVCNSVHPILDASVSQI